MNIYAEWQLDHNTESIYGSDYENDANYNHGQGMWEKFISQYENIFLVMSGHNCDEDVVYRQDYGVHGNVVTQILIDFQDVDKAYVEKMAEWMKYLWGEKN